MPALSYTPIIINFVPPILNADGEALNKNESVRLAITTPTSYAYGVTQALKKKFSIGLPSSGLLRLKLLASDCYNPMGRYKVEYFLGGNSIASDTQYWVVPSPPPLRNVIIAHADDSGTYTFTEKDYVFDVVNTSIAGGAYTYNYPQIVWSTGAPEAGFSYSVTYQPAVTLDQLIYSDATQRPHSHSASY